MSDVAPISPCLWFEDQAEDAAAVYTRLLPDSSITGTARYPETFDNPSGKPRGSVMTVEFELAGVPFTALNGGPTFTPNPSISFMLNFDPGRDPQARENLETTWEALSEGGTPLMPLDEYPFSELYGWVQDRFGVSWQLILTDPEGEERPFLVPSLLFVGDVVGRAEEAIDHYTSVFENAHRGETARYPSGMEPNQEGTLMFADFALDGQWFACMDSAEEHDFAFTEGISLQIVCADQSEVDHYWHALTAGGGEEGPCGWLTDRFGVSWQVVPRSFVRMMTAGEVGSERAFQAMLDMTKLDIEALEEAFDGDPEHEAPEV